MIYKSTVDGQWHKVNPDYKRFDAEQSYIRRKLFKNGIFRIDWDRGNDCYHLFVKDWAIGCWSSGDSEKAHTFIRAAFDTYYALTRRK